VPALIVRRASTTIELRDGQSFVIGGLLQNTSKSKQEQVPWLADVPVLGTLFSSRSYIKDETDLAIIVTPRLVRPARPGDPIKTPLDNTLPANDADFFLDGKAEIPRAQQRAVMGVERPFAGHVIDLPRHVLDLPKGGQNVVASKN
jgi:pilus assembly protein CpaC